MRLCLPCFSLIAILAAACSDEGSDALKASSDVGSTDGSAAGSGEGSAACWFETGAGFCPTPPTGLPADGCPGAPLEGSGFAAGTGLCAPDLADWSCPEGWSTTPRFAESSARLLPSALAALRVCEPPPEPPSDCPPGTIALPGHTDCQRMGLACPASGTRWHDEPTLRAQAPGFPGPIVYLSPDAAPDGTGTRDNPRLLSAAAVRAAEDGILALSIGTHNAAVRLDRHVALLGACVEATTLTTDQPSETIGLVDISPNGAVRVSNLTITGPRPGIWVRGEVASPHEIEAVTVAETPVYGLLFESPQVTNLRRVRVHDTLARSSTQTLGRGIELQAGARVVSEEVALQRVREVGVVLSGSGSTFEATRLLVEETRPRDSDRAFGRGVAVNAGANARLVNALVRDNYDIGISISGADATLDAEQLVVLRTAPNGRGILGRGVEVKGGGGATITDGLLRANHEVSLIATDAGSSLRATRLRVHDTRPAPSEAASGVGLLVQAGATALLSDVAVDGSVNIGIEVLGAGSRITAAGVSVAATAEPAVPFETGSGLVVRDRGRLVGDDLLLVSNVDVGLFVADVGSVAAVNRLLVNGTVPSASDGRFGHGVQVEREGSLTASDLALRGNSEVAVDVSGAGSIFRANRVVIDATLPRVSDGRAGRAIELSGGAEVEVSDALVRGNSELAVFASDTGTRFVANRLVVSDTAPQRAGILGHGLSLQEGVVASLADLVVSTNHGVGIIVTGAGTRVDLLRAAITETAPHPVDGRFGIGLGLYNQAHLSGEDIALLRNKRCALQLAGPAVTLALRRVRLSGSEVGTNLQADGLDLSALQAALQEEQYDSNGEDVTISAVEVPDPTTVLGDAAAP